MLVEEGQKSPGSRVFVGHCDVRWEGVCVKEDGGLAHNARFEGVDRAAVKKRKSICKKNFWEKSPCKKSSWVKIMLYIYMMGCCGIFHHYDMDEMGWSIFGGYPSL